MPLKDPEARRAFDRKRSKERRASGYIAPTLKQNMIRVTELKAATPCMECGNKFHPICMDFDHVRGEKVEEVSRLVANGCEWKVISAEIDKCDIVCANCHRVRSMLTNWGRNG